MPDPRLAMLTSSLKTTALAELRLRACLHWGHRIRELAGKPLVSESMAGELAECSSMASLMLTMLADAPDLVTIAAEIAEHADHAPSATTRDHVDRLASEFVRTCSSAVDRSWEATNRTRRELQGEIQALALADRMQRERESARLSELHADHDGLGPIARRHDGEWQSASVKSRARDHERAHVFGSASVQIDGPVACYIEHADTPGAATYQVAQ